jgi:probable F420-dependent oxidoreductase
MPGPEESPIADPILALAYAAAISTKLRLATGIVILPQRHPVYVAKEFATLDVLSRGRAIAGVGIGWLEEEFAVLGVPFRERAARTEESVRAIRTLWQDGAQPFRGKFYSWDAVHSNPKPIQKPGVPIVIGGHVEGAARRAARVGDGFFPAKGGLGSLPNLFEAMRDECGKVGRDPAEIELTAVGTKLEPDTVRAYEDIGVSRLVVPPPAFDPEGLKRALHEFADNVIAKQ